MQLVLQHCCKTSWIATNTDDGLFTTHVQTCQQPDLLHVRFDVGGKTRNIAIQLVLLQCCKTSCTFFVARFSVPLGDVRQDDSQRRFLAQHSVATLLRCCFELLQHCTNIATLCCPKNRRCKSSSWATAMRTASKSTDLMSKKNTNLHVRRTFLYISLRLFCTTKTWNSFVTHHFFEELSYMWSPKILLLVLLFALFSLPLIFHLAGRQYFSFSHCRYEIVMFFFQRNSSPLFSITHFSFFSVIHLSVAVMLKRRPCRLQTV